MEPKLVFLIGAIMMLANGGVLGLMHRDLPAALQPAAVSWRIGTLLIAGGSILFVVQDRLPPGFVLPLANGLVILGFTGYLRALRQFYGLPDRWWLLLPLMAGALGVFWFAAVQPSLVARVALISVIWLVLMLACVMTLRAYAWGEAAISPRVLAGIFSLIIVFIILRALYFLLTGVPGGSVTAAGWMNLLTPLVAAILPVIGTTAFLLMCSERIRRQWEHAASTDYLTGLANRRTLAAAGSRRFAAFHEHRSGLALAVIDIDHFKSINDRYGHDTGDLALRHVAARLESACRSPDLPARQGGEEFVVLFDGVDGERARAVGERLRQAVAAEPFVAGEVSLPLTVSIGVAVQVKGDRDFDSLLRRADEALYAAKSGGRNRVELA